MTQFEEKAFVALTEALNEAGITWEDTTWGNDLTASVGIGDDLWVYVPNSEYLDHDEEMFSHYTVIDEDSNHVFDALNVCTIVNFLKDSM